MTETETAPAMIPRYVRSTFEPDEYTYDIVYTDRLTGKVVMSYDGADPANTNPAYGAKPDSDYLASHGHDINAEIEIGQSVLPVPAGEADRHAAIKRRRAEIEEEENSALDLLDFIGKEAEAFSFDHYGDGEQEILRPALEKRGYTLIRFYNVEADSFGPLIRGCVATCHCGKRVRFFYG